MDLWTAGENTRPKVNLKLLLMSALNFIIWVCVTPLCIYGNLVCRFVGEAYEAVTDAICETLWKEPLTKSSSWLKIKRPQSMYLLDSTGAVNASNMFGCLFWTDASTGIHFYESQCVLLHINCLQTSQSSAVYRRRGNSTGLPDARFGNLRWGYISA